MNTVSEIRLSEDVVTSSPGVFGAEHRRVQLARRIADNAYAFIAPASPLEGHGFVAWCDGEYSRHYVNADPIEAARVVIEDAYGPLVVSGADCD